MNQGDAAIVRAGVRATSPDQAVETLNRLYPSGRPKVTGKPAGIGSMELRSARCGSLSSESLRMRLRYDGCTDPFENPLAILMLGGRLRVTTGSGDYRVGASDCFLFPTVEGASFEVFPYDVVATGVARADVEQAAHRLYGMAPRDLRFGTGWPVDASRGLFWKSLTGHVRQAMSIESSDAFGALVATQLREYVAAAMLFVFPNSAMRLDYAPPAGEVGSAALRRAVGFAEEHASEPLSIDDLARAAGSTARALQYAFRRRYDCTPTQFLRRLRLERAHQELQQSDPSTTTVTAIASRWGFVSRSWFSRHYQATYGQPPSATLRRGH